MTIKIRLWKSSFVSRRASDSNANAKASRVLVENSNNNKTADRPKTLRAIVYVQNLNPFNLVVGPRRTLIFRSFVIIHCSIFVLHSLTYQLDFKEVANCRHFCFSNQKMAMNGGHTFARTISENISPIQLIFPFFLHTFFASDLMN